MMTFMLHVTAGLNAIFWALVAWIYVRGFLNMPILALAAFTVVLFGAYFGLLKIIL